jgi:hypothetical protein
MQMLFYLGGLLLKEYFRLKKEYASVGDLVAMICTSLQLNAVIALPAKVASNMAPIPLDSEELGKSGHFNIVWLREAETIYLLIASKNCLHLTAE